ncbi:uncharacterized protein LOC127639924 isoform X1 [Xyrauchen texanus]|uniref:uncharacterized protein LOC127639924 isoform X1 n=1 Tax=Xyrauchen texanus TaxID=154827 RepID=UPI0022427A31|nr:uncharacterized protein LOC127639924 isoform X1 [Xyrauchen texanus]
MNRLTLAMFVSVLLDGGFGVGTDEVKAVTEGDSVTLNIDYTGIKYILIQWFAPQHLYIARIDGDDNKVSYGDDKMFRDRVQLDQTGSLTIRNIRIKHSGQYEVEIISSRGTSYQKYNLTVRDSPRVSREQTEELKTLSLMEGDPVTLYTDVYKTYGDELILWRFGSEGSLIAKCDLEDNNISLSDDADERFSGRLQLDQTGSITITNSRITDTGLYQLQFTNNRETKYRRFTVTVSAVTDAGLSSGAVAGISVAVVVLLIAAAVSAGYYYYQISELKKQMDEKTVLVMKGDSVPLSIDDAHIQSDDVNVYFGDTLIAEVRRRNIASPVNDEIRERLQLHPTGSLIITDTEYTDSGLYELKIISSSREITYKRLTVTVCGELVPMPVVEGGSVTLNTFTVIVEDVMVVWKFGNTLIANKNTEDESISLYEDVLDGIFRGRLKVNKQTGSLTITNIGRSHSGEYELYITSSRATVHQKFSVTLIGRSRSGSVNESPAENVLDVTEAVRDGANETDPLLNINAAVGVNEQLGTSV